MRLEFAGRCGFSLAWRTLWLPTMLQHGRRYRVRDKFPEGTVWRVWVGCFLIVVMVDARFPGQSYPPMPRSFPPPPVPPAPSLDPGEAA